MANLREILTRLVASQGPPETGTGQYGRAGGVGAGPKKAIKGVKTAMAGPAMQRDYNQQISSTETLPPISPLTSMQNTPMPAQISQSLRAGPPSGPPDIQPYAPPEIPATPLEGSGQVGAGPPSVSMEGGPMRQVQSTPELETGANELIAQDLQQQREEQALKTLFAMMQDQQSRRY